MGILSAIFGSDDFNPGPHHDRTGDPAHDAKAAAETSFWNRALEWRNAASDVDVQCHGRYASQSYATAEAYAERAEQ